ncbi:GNAT family N-acetyltransferase [Nitrosophilus kaiyonis]|uniref:GNAT family N-acetyltransferase n=1 Tax=Nitrosophilus kaiyonis TaxID=2930200 RepID=UPI0024926996|nr:GNAT family N-acetyltransferase [Nitrosophilus kaiyonis]
MKNRFFIKLYNDIEYWELIKAFYEKLCSIISFPKKEAKELENAIKELFENAVIHAYSKNEEGEIEIEFELFDNGIKVDVKDKGLPFDPKILKMVPIDLKEKNRGLNRVFLLVDSFKYFNLGLHGKKFSILKYVPISLKLKENISYYSDIGDDLDKSAKELIKDKLQVRLFEEGDEIWISKLIYKNYGYTYFKDIFYFPEKILQKEKSGDISSIVAQIDKKIVGHFALVKVPNSNIAEIGIAVVDPAYKGMGIMNEMFKLLINRAKELNLSAIFGEAVTFHPYSQKANAKYGFCPTALMLGEIHQMVKLKGHKYPFRNRRGASLVDYKILKKFKKYIKVPSFYKDWVIKTYKNCSVDFEINKNIGEKEHKVFIEHNPKFNIATIVIDNIDDDFEKQFKSIFEKTLSKHPDMIYADINLEEISDIDKTVKVLKEFDFFYSGVIFLRRKDIDYLRLQYEASEIIEEQNIVCYSDFCKELHNFILSDKNKYI